ncbi:hypothetical protein BC831DRAFT_253478 [Entophlyctis helioformis]|nr:hypothetical protein BC831DRAFT_253478 [Entophlyctis helioformis]
MAHLPQPPAAQSGPAVPTSRCPESCSSPSRQSLPVVSLDSATVPGLGCTRRCPTSPILPLYDQLGDVSRIALLATLVKADSLQDCSLVVSPQGVPPPAFGPLPTTARSSTSSGSTASQFASWAPGRHVPSPDRQRFDEESGTGHDVQPAAESFFSSHEAFAVPVSAGDARAMDTAASAVPGHIKHEMGSYDSGRGSALPSYGPETSSSSPSTATPPSSTALPGHLLADSSRPHWTDSSNIDTNSTGKSNIIDIQTRHNTSTSTSTSTSTTHTISIMPQPAHRSCIQTSWLVSINRRHSVTKIHVHINSRNHQRLQRIIIIPLTTPTSSVHHIRPLALEPAARPRCSPLCCLARRCQPTQALPCRIHVASSILGTSEIERRPDLAVTEIHAVWAAKLIWPSLPCPRRHRQPRDRQQAICMAAYQP